MALRGCELTDSLGQWNPDVDEDTSPEMYYAVAGSPTPGADMCRTRVAADLAATRIRRSYGDYRPWVLYLSAALSQSWFDRYPVLAVTVDLVAEARTKDDAIFEKSRVESH